VSWIPLFAALGALVIAVAVLGYCAYEIAWRSRRLQRDLQQLRELGDGFATLQGELAAAQQRLPRPGAG
jgi:hypothetical protein